MNKLLFIFCSLLILGCAENGTQQEKVSRTRLKEPLIEANKKNAEREAALIDKYIERRSWKMVETGTGLRYQIYKKGNGRKAEQGDRATVAYEIKLLDGTLCYKTEEGDSRDFIIGQDNVESGVHEGVSLMRVGDHAKLILPSHLAHGVTGDLNKIPPQSVLVIDLKLLDLR